MVCVDPPADASGGGSPRFGLPAPHEDHQQEQSGGPENSVTPLPTPSDGAGAGDDGSKKVRKPYTITKSRESWTEQEHDKFLEALHLFDRDWKKIEAFVGSKTVIQIRSHAQKYFLKVQKNGASEHVPPPRPKRKAAHPYPQKASKNVPLSSQPSTPFQASSCILEKGYAVMIDSIPMLGNSSGNTTVSAWTHSSFQPVGVSCGMEEDLGPTSLGTSNHQSVSIESPSGHWLSSEAEDQVKQFPSLRVMPDFAQVYTFLGNVFDPCSSGHLQKLKELDPIDVETVLLLMRNLTINLSSSEIGDHIKLVMTHDQETSGLPP